MSMDHIKVAEMQLLKELQSLRSIAEDQGYSLAVDYLSSAIGDIPDRAKWISKFRKDNGCSMQYAISEYERRFCRSLWENYGILA